MILLVLRIAKHTLQVVFVLGVTETVAPGLSQAVASQVGGFIGRLIF